MHIFCYSPGEMLLDSCSMSVVCSARYREGLTLANPGFFGLVILRGSHRLTFYRKVLLMRQSSHIWQPDIFFLRQIRYKIWGKVIKFQTDTQGGFGTAVKKPDQIKAQSNRWGVYNHCQVIKNVFCRILMIKMISLSPPFWLVNLYISVIFLTILLSP